MGMSCSVCNHEDRLMIDREIVKGISHTQIARSFKVSNDSVRHHAFNHLSRQLIKSNEMQQAIVSGGLVSEMEDLLTRSKNILNKAEAKGALNTALGAIAQTRGTLELMSKIVITLHQVRVQELQMRESNEEYAPLAPDAIDRFNDGELLMFISLTEKLTGERSKNEDVIITVLKELKGTYDPSLRSPSAYYSLATDSKRRARRKRTKFPKNYVEPVWDEEAALAEEKRLALEVEELNPLTQEPLDDLELVEEPKRGKAGIWGKNKESGFEQALREGRVRTPFTEGITR